MDVTLLGSGDALGMPAPLCDCEYCTESDPRRRPGLLVAGEDGVESHGRREDLAASLSAADADRTVLVNASEHLARVHEDVLESRARDYGSELGADLATFEV